jgi:hypothetical protein
VAGPGAALWAGHETGTAGTNRQGHRATESRPVSPPVSPAVARCRMRRLDVAYGRSLPARAAPFGDVCIRGSDLESRPLRVRVHNLDPELKGALPRQDPSAGAIPGRAVPPGRRVSRSGTAVARIVTACLVASPFDVSSTQYDTQPLTATPAAAAPLRAGEGGRRSHRSQSRGSVRFRRGASHPHIPAKFDSSRGGRASRAARSTLCDGVWDTRRRGGVLSGSHMTPGRRTEDCLSDEPEWNRAGGARGESRRYRDRIAAIREDERSG